MAGSISYSGGASVRQRSSTRPQRSAKMQPSGTTPGGGREPGIVSSARFALSVSRRGMQRSSPTVYGWRGLLNTSRAGPSSTSSPAYSTPTRSHIFAITPRLWLMNRNEVSNSVRSAEIRSRTSDSTVASSAVVGSSRISSAGSAASAIAITTRWSMPPESWWG